jgi:type I restriction enzyme S subunit
VLKEVKAGIGENWSKYPVLGATRKGLAPAKEPPGKNPQKYKPAFQETVFYNPMRILIGSIAFVDDDDEPGITSPDYVVLRGKQGILDTRWFYYWLKSSLVNSVSTRLHAVQYESVCCSMSFKGEIELPSYKAQLNASKHYLK